MGRSEAVLSTGVRSLSCVIRILLTISTLQGHSVVATNLRPITRKFSSVKKITLVGNLFALYNEKGYHRDDEKFDTRAYEEEAEEREELEELKEMEEMEEMEERRRARKENKARKAKKAESLDHVEGETEDLLLEDLESGAKSAAQLADDALLVGCRIHSSCRMKRPMKNL